MSLFDPLRKTELDLASLLRCRDSVMNVTLNFINFLSSVVSAVKASLIYKQCQ